MLYANPSLLAVHIQVDAAEAVTGSPIAKMVRLFSALPCNAMPVPGCNQPVRSSFLSACSCCCKDGVPVLLEDYVSYPDC